MSQVTQANNVGRPPLWTDPAQLEADIQAYFDECEEGREVTELTKRGEVVTYTKQRPPTLEGLADNLGTTGSTLRRYAKRDEFYPIISRARNRIYRSWIERGIDGSYNPKIVALVLAANNRDYNISQQHDITVTTVEDQLRQMAHDGDAEIVPQIEDKG